MSVNQQLMEQMAEKFVHDKPDSSFTKVFEKLAFKEGWQARDKVLLEAGVQLDMFDVVAANEDYCLNLKADSEPSFIAGARYQHNLLTIHYEARLAKLKAIVKENVEEHCDCDSQGNDRENYFCDQCETYFQVCDLSGIKEGGEDE